MVLLEANSVRVAPSPDTGGPFSSNGSMTTPLWAARSTVSWLGHRNVTALLNMEGR